jgi:hypothetical protein
MTTGESPSAAADSLKRRKAIRKAREGKGRDIVDEKQTSRDDYSFRGARS